jgi:adenylate cyclase
METHGTPKRIQITRATYELLADDFDCEPRGKIAVKGKGEIETWYLVGRRGNRADEVRSSSVLTRPPDAVTEA